jgi:dinuclear metal center YbgI/SA1388 family protein
LNSSAWKGEGMEPTEPLGAITLETVLQFLNATLGIPEFPDYEGALNGLQVGVQDVQTRRISRVAAAVDASVASVQAAVESGADLLLVHHGIFWGGPRPIIGRDYRRIATLVRGDVALYAAHLPLDAHPEVGNAIGVLRALELEPSGRFGHFGQAEIGFEARLEEGRTAFKDRVAEVVGGPVRVVPGGPDPIRRLGVVTGGAGSLIRDAASAGLDTLLTGEATHHHALDAMELGINLVLAGHYATETWGVRALAARLEEEFGLPWDFLDLPTGF